MAAFDPEVFGDGKPKGGNFDADVFNFSTQPVDISAETSGKKESAQYKAGRDSSWRGMVSGLQGPMLGFADEVLGGLGALGRTAVNGGSLKDNYTEMRDFYRGATKQSEEDNPILSQVFRAAAGAPAMMFGGGAAPAVGMARNALTAAKTGAAFGGVSGLGNSDSEDPLRMALDAAGGAVSGGVLSGAALPIANAIGGAGRVGYSMLSESAAARYAKQKVAEALARDARGPLAQSNPDAALRQAAAEMSKLGREGRVVDSAGQNTRQLLDTIATLPGRTKDSVETAILSRQAGRADRLQNAAEKGLNPSGLRLQTTIDDLVQRRAEDAVPIYDKLYKQGVFVNEELQGLIDAAKKLGAGAEAKTIAVAKNVPYSLERDVKWAPMRDLDYLKQGLDTIIEKSKNDFGKLTKVGVAINGLKNDLVAVLDSETKGLYKQARDAYAGPSALIDAARDGRRFWTTDDQTITKALSSMSHGEQDAFKLGAFEALRSKLGNQPGQTEIMRVWRDKTTREKLQSLFGDEKSFSRFVEKAAAESRMKGMESVGRGSQTAARQFGAGDLDAAAVTNAAGIITSASNGNVPGFLAGATSLWNKVKTPEPVRDEMGNLLLSQGKAGRMTLQELRQAMRDVTASRSREAGLLGVGVGNLFGPVNPAGGLLGGM